MPRRIMNFFYPNSTWTGDNGFNVSNASVKEYQIITNNGYIYNVDRVLEPLETIYDVLKKKSDYSDFLDFYSQYSTYAYDKDLSADYGKAVGVDSLFSACTFTKRASEYRVGMADT